MTHLLLFMMDFRGEDIEGEEGEVVAERVGSDSERFGEVLEGGTPEERGGKRRRELEEAIATLKEWKRGNMTTTR